MALPGKRGNIEDLAPLAAGSSIVFAVAVILDVLSVKLTSFFYLLDLVPAALVVVTVFYSLKTQEFLGGAVGRSMSLVAAGISIYGFTFHLVNLPYQEFSHPTIYGL
ncbi:MAG: hypothetical protein ABEK04_06090, partial [Candidatus Nanohalobium sp.]